MSVSTVPPSVIVHTAVFILPIDTKLTPVGITNLFENEFVVTICDASPPLPSAYAAPPLHVVGEDAGDTATSWYNEFPLSLNL